MPADRRRPNRSGGSSSRSALAAFVLLLGLWEAALGGCGDATNNPSATQAPAMSTQPPSAQGTPSTETTAAATNQTVDAGTLVITHTASLPADAVSIEYSGYDTFVKQRFAGVKLARAPQHTLTNVPMTVVRLHVDYKDAGGATVAMEEINVQIVRNQVAYATITEVGTTGTGNFIVQSVRIVDYDATNNNVLVRGSEAFGAPVSANGKTIPTEVPYASIYMLQAIQLDPNFCTLPAAIQANITSAINSNTAPLTVDFCLIGYPTSGTGDALYVSQELAWFNCGGARPVPSVNGATGPYPYYIEAQSNLGNNGSFMVYWPVSGITGLATVGSPIPSTWADNIAPGSNYDFYNLVQTIGYALHNQTCAFPSPAPGSPPLPTLNIQNAIIYVHCDSGVNRTGAAVAAYLVQNGSLVLAPSPDPSPSPSCVPATSPSPAASPTCSPVTPPRLTFTLSQAQQAAAYNPPGNPNGPDGSFVGNAQGFCNYLVDPTAATVVTASAPWPSPTIVAVYNPTVNFQSGSPLCVPSPSPSPSASPSSPSSSEIKDAWQNLVH